MRTSVFGKVVAIMVIMAVSLMTLVTGFFGAIVSPNLNHSIDGVLEEYARTVAATSPTLEEATDIAARINVDVRYEGPGGDWSTRKDLPSVSDVRRGGMERENGFLPRREYQLVRAPSGGTYLFAWSLGGHMFEAHTALLLMLLLVMVAVILAANMVLKRLLQPLTLLNEGVARLGAGELDVQLPRRTRDEFGVLTDAFNQMVGRVREMLRARDQLLADVSHELRSPVTRMKVALELLPDVEQRARLVDDVSEMDRMVTELLELERLRARRGVTTARQHLVPILREVVERFEERAPGVLISATSEEIVADIDGDKVRMVMRNLLENAVKYSLPDSRPIDVAVAEAPNAVVVRVADDGVGIPADEVSRLFEPFVRVDPSRSKETGGYGLGLSICKRVMEAHGGAIAVERTGVRGATFVLTFPKPG